MERLHRFDITFSVLVLPLECDIYILSHSDGVTLTLQRAHKLLWLKSSHLSSVMGCHRAIFLVFYTYIIHN